MEGPQREVQSGKIASSVCGRLSMMILGIGESILRMKRNGFFEDSQRKIGVDHEDRRWRRRGKTIAAPGAIPARFEGNSGTATRNVIIGRRRAAITMRPPPPRGKRRKACRQRHVYARSSPSNERHVRVISEIHRTDPRPTSIAPAARRGCIVRESRAAPDRAGSVWSRRTDVEVLQLIRDACTFANDGLSSISGAICRHGIQ